MLHPRLLTSLLFASTLVVPTSALGAPRLLAEGSLVAVTDDGRTALTADGVLLDTGTGAKRPAGPGTMLDLPSAGEALLVSRTDGRLVVRDGSSETPVDVGPGGSRVAWAGDPILVRGGAAVVLQTDEQPSRILLRDVAAGTTTEVMRNATLLGASEDGAVISWRRALPNLTRPAGQAPLAGDPAGGYPAAAVGYTVAGGSPRVVAVTSVVQERLGDPTSCTGAFAGADVRQPVDLEIAGTSGRYSLFLSESVGDAGYPGTRTVWSRSGADGALTQFASDVLNSSYVEVRVNRTDGSHAVVVNRKSSYPLWNSATVYPTAAEGWSTSLPPLAEGFDELGLFTPVFSAAGGSFAVFGARPRTTGAPGIYRDERSGSATAPSPTLDLPRPADPVLTDALRGAASWVTCGDTAQQPAVGEFGDYVAFTPQSGATGARLRVTPAPDGLVPILRTRVVLTFFGIPLSDRTFPATTTEIQLPAIPSWLPGVIGGARVTLGDGTDLDAWAPLSR